MNKSFKKKLSLLLAGVMCLSIISIAPLAFGDDLVAINSTNFPDNNFRQFVSDSCDSNGDGYLNESERSITELPLSAYVYENDIDSISSLTGVEYFTSLVKLRVGYLNLESLDVSALTSLTELTCQGNLLTSLDLSANTSLVTLNCSDNNLTSLILPETTTLTKVHCYANSLTSLDVGVASGLTELRCDQNELTQLDLSNNSALSMLYCYANSLTSLDLSATSVTNATNDQIGNQELDAEAELRYGIPFVPFEDKGLDFDNYRSCSLDNYEDGSTYEGDGFSIYNLDDIADGFTYECYVYEDSCENMTVHINVIRDFYQVSFYTSESMDESLGISFVNSGEDATAPTVSDTPQCKTFNGWSDDITNITEDKKVYIVWSDSHTYTPTAMADDNDTITVSCENGDSSYVVSFISIINTSTGDENFDENLDVVKDGHINAKDYSLLYNTLK